MMEIMAALAGVRVAGNMLGRLLQGGPQTAAEAAPPEQPELPLAVADDSAGRLRRIAARYDLRNISPGELSSLLQELHQAGLIGDQQYHELSLIRLDLDGADVDQDEAVDLLEFYAEKLEELSESAAAMPTSEFAAAIEPLRRRQAWLQKLALFQSAPDAAGLDAVA